MVEVVLISKLVIHNALLPADNFLNSLFKIVDNIFAGQYLQPAGST